MRTALPPHRKAQNWAQGGLPCCKPSGTSYFPRSARRCTRTVFCTVWANKTGRNHPIPTCYPITSPPPPTTTAGISKSSSTLGGQ